MTRRIANPPEAPAARSGHRKWARCCAGELPAEALTVHDREDLLVELHTRGWTDTDIAAHTRMTTYTTARIRDRIGLVPNERSDP